MKKRLLILLLLSLIIIISGCSNNNIGPDIGEGGNDDVIDQVHVTFKTNSS